MGPAAGDYIRNPRRSLRAHVACSATLTAAGGTFEARTEDVGAHGCRMVSPRLVRKGEPVRLELGHALLGERLRVNGRIVWTTDAAPWRLGVAFDEAGHAETARWFAQLLARGGFPAPQRVPDRIPLCTMVYLGPPPRFVLDLTAEEMTVLREVGTGASVAMLLARFPGQRPMVERSLFSLLAQRLATLSRGSSVHPNAWGQVLPPAVEQQPALQPAVAPPSPKPKPPPAKPPPGAATPVFLAMVAPERWTSR